MLVDELELADVPSDAAIPYVAAGACTVEALPIHGACQVSHQTHESLLQVLCSPVIRRHFKRLTEKFIPNMVVVSHNELSPEVNIRSFGTVRL